MSQSPGGAGIPHHTEESPVCPQRDAQQILASEFAAHFHSLCALTCCFFYDFVTCGLQGTSLCEALHTLNWIEHELSCVLQSKAVITPWVGLRKINVSYWCWEDMSPFTNSTLQWLPGEPSDAGFCGYLAEPTFNGLKAATCVNSVNGSLCERPSEKDAHTHITLTSVHLPY